MGKSGREYLTITWGIMTPVVFLFLTCCLLLATVGCTFGPAYKIRVREVSNINSGIQVERANKAKEAEGEPISHVVISIWRSSSPEGIPVTIRTDDKGRHWMSYLGTGPLYLICEKSGYVSVEGMIEKVSRRDLNLITVHMAPVKETTDD